MTFEQLTDALTDRGDADLYRLIERGKLNRAGERGALAEAIVNGAHVVPEAFAGWGLTVDDGGAPPPRKEHP